MRTLLSALLIAVPVTLILTLVGLTHGLIEDSEQRTRGIGADIWVRPEGASFATALSGAPIPEGMVKYFEVQPHVKLDVGSVVQPIQGTLAVSGIDLEKFNEVSGGLHYLEGGARRA